MEPDLWRKAIATLDDKERIELTRGNALMTVPEVVDEMIILATKRRQQCEKSRWKTFRFHGSEISLSDTATKIIIWLNKFKEIGDIIVQYDPVHAALPWAIVRFVLQATIVTKEQMAASLAIIERVTGIIHRCQIFQTLYNRNTIDQAVVQNLESALVKLYTSVLRALLEVNKFLSMPAYTQSLYAIFHPGMGSSHLDSLKQGETEVDREIKACEGQRRSNTDVRFEKHLRGLLNLTAPILHIDESVKQVLQKLDRGELIQVLQWISPIEYTRHHNTVRELRTKSTCDWLLQRPKFIQWSSTTSSITLWLRGFPGAGKTHLASKVIEKTQATLEGTENDEGFAFFYCNRNEENRRNALDILRSYVRQLSTPLHRSGLIYSELKHRYGDSQLCGSGWTLGSCQDYLIRLLNLYPRAALILDALDECHPEERTRLLDFFDSIPSKSSKPVRIFISSRPEGDIHQRLVHLPSIEIQATDNEDDIAKFVLQSIERNGRWNDTLRKDQLLKNEIIQTLLDKSNGMFQWANLQIKQLLDLRTKHQIRERLGKLPKDLEAAYDQIYERIEGLDMNSKALSLRALKWITCAYKPLNNEELLAAVHVDPEEGLPKSLDTTEADLLDWCANLIRVDSQQDPPVWRVSHLSVVEYLENRWTMLDAHCFVAKASLAFLQETYGDEHRNFLRPTGIFHPGHQLQIYVRHYWISHVQTQEHQTADPKLATLLKAFLGSPGQSSVQYRRWHRALDYKIMASNGSDFVPVDEISPNSSSAFLACRFSFYNLLRDWWDTESLNSSQLTYSGDSLLSLAVVGEQMPLCITLCEAGIQVNAPLRNRKYSSALEAAVFRENIDMVKALIEKGADINMPFRDLLFREEDYSNVFIAAICRGKLEIAQLLIDKGADVNMSPQTGNYGSALVAAIHCRNLESIQLLIDKGADVNMTLQRGYCGSALIAAAYHENLEITRLLIDKGADVNISPQTGNYGSALVAAAYMGRMEIVELLVENNANITVHLQQGLYRNALDAARTSKKRKNGFFSHLEEELKRLSERKSQVACFLESRIL
ncbi:hypothetical protein F4803DRAFT_528891 [Xylaria telfairii]|nr:hypothetical protein F4803DRAFT_528891 [Xylaria telfairii]